MTFAEVYQDAITRRLDQFARLSFLTADGDELIPIVDDTHFLTVYEGFAVTDVHVAFYDADGDIVTPTGGTVTVSGSIVDGQWQAPSIGGEIDATEAGAEATYDVARIEAPVSRLRAVASGITGAASMRIVVLQHQI